MTTLRTTAELEPEDRQQLVDRMTEAIVDGLSKYTQAYKQLTRQAKTWFEERAWKDAQAGAVRRLELYGEAVSAMNAKAHAILGDFIEDRGLWADVKVRYARAIADRNDEEIAETFSTR